MRSAAITAVDLDPADLAHQTHAVSNYFNQIKTHEANRVHAGGLAGAPTSASTQLTGAAGVTEWRIDVTALLAAVGGVVKELAVVADEVIHDTTVLVTAAGQTCWAAVVLKNVAGTISMVTVKGTAAATASAVPPTDAEIQAGVGAGNDWVKIAECEITRTADTTVTQSQDNTKRPMFGINVDENFAAFTG
ncbi:MAG: hypothetical protein KJN79_00175 [Gammaproteobacteria bacterium]|nr:hypothetical protein [Gammaproteobacteria bacterium]